MQHRLPTQQLIRQTRSQHHIQQQQARIQQLQTTLSLKNKQIEHNLTQIQNVKQEMTMRVKIAEGEVVSYKKELAEMRYAHVREMRNRDQKHAEEIRKTKKNCQSALIQKNNEVNNKLQSMRLKYENELTSAKQNYRNYLQMQKQQHSISHNLSQEHHQQSTYSLHQAQQQREEERKARKEAEKQLEAYKQAMSILKEQYQRSLAARDDENAEKKGEIEGLKLRVKLMEQREEEERRQKFQMQNNNAMTIEQLRQNNHKLVQEVERYKATLSEKQSQLFASLKQPTNKNIPAQIQPNYQCQHQGLIYQLQRNLQLKQDEIQELRHLVEEWTDTIGFDRPLAQRLQQISDKNLQAKQLNIEWGNSLKAHVNKKKKQFRY